jgi:hypothetical protein
MHEHKPVAWFGKSSWPAEQSSWAMSIAVGALIAVAGFTLILSGVAWFVPKFLRFADSRWVHLLPAISILFISTSGLLHYLRKRRPSIRRARSAVKS